MLDRYIVHQCRDPDYIEFLKHLVSLNALKNPALDITKMILAGNSRGMSKKQAQVFKYYVYDKFNKQYCKECRAYVTWKDMVKAMRDGYLCYDCFGLYK